MNLSLKVGTRGSELAQRQSALVEAALLNAQSDLNLERCIIQTAGDMRLDIPLNEVNRATNTQDKGVFIAALEEALASGEIDCAVHSLKDMPGILDERFEIAAVLPREEINDVLIVKEGANLERLLIGTSSVRRVRSAECYWGGTALCMPIRGNVATRLRKLVESPEMDAILLAQAGLNRLDYPKDHFEIDGTKLFVVKMSIGAFMPALGQGAIAVEIRKGDEHMKSLLSLINDPQTEACVRCERSFLRSLAADCSVPVGGYANIIEDAMFFRALYFTEEGTPIRVEQRGSAAAPEELGISAFEQLRYRLND
ncbi:MAG: hydroxymethylbilane synthase [Akkermansia sp.]